MTRARVTEIRPVLEPVVPDPFVSDLASMAAGGENPAVRVLAPRSARSHHGHSRGR